MFHSRHFFFTKSKKSKLKVEHCHRITVTNLKLERSAPCIVLNYRRSVLHTKHYEFKIPCISILKNYLGKMFDFKFE